MKKSEYVKPLIEIIDLIDVDIVTDSNPEHGEGGGGSGWEEE